MAREAERVVCWDIGPVLKAMEVADRAVRLVMQGALDPVAHRRLRMVQLEFHKNIIEVNEDIIQTMVTFRGLGFKQALLARRGEKIRGGSRDLGYEPYEPIRPYVDYYETAYDTEAVSNALNKLGSDYSRERTVMIGDRVMSMIAAKQLGMYAVGLSLQSSDAHAKQLAAEGADKVMKDTRWLADEVTYHLLIGHYRDN